MMDDSELFYALGIDLFPTTALRDLDPQMVADWESEQADERADEDRRDNPEED